MKISNKVYLNFELEKKIMLIGIPLVGFILNFIFYDGILGYFSIENIINLFITILVTGINWMGCRYIVVKLWNNYPWHIQPVKHILIEIPTVLGFTIGMNFTVFYIFSIFEYKRVNYTELWQSTSIIILLVSFIISLHEAMFFYFQWKENFNKSLSLEKANIKAEYDALKNQINPHFLFNNLNTLTTYVEDNSIAINYIQNLSDFLRYTLDLKEYDIKTLKDELYIAKKYIYLQKSRFGNNLIVKIDIEDKYLSNKLPSMSLQMTIDNAIKHNIISKDKPLTINIFIENESYIVIENILQKRYDAISTNQGLQNLKKRYAFISEKDIIIIDDKDKFIVKLPLA